MLYINGRFDTLDAMAPRSKARSDAVIGYCRVSTDGQAESGAGLEAQRHAIQSECNRRGWELAWIYQDVASGKSREHRPALAEALQILADGEASVLVVGKLDRLARSVHDFAGLVCTAEKQGWAILAADLAVDMTSPTGGLLANVTAAVAEWERKIIGARTREALAARKAAGVKLGRPRRLPADVADRIHSERENGRTLQAIADQLNADGVLTPTGRTWNHTLVRQVSLQPA